MFLPLNWLGCLLIDELLVPDVFPKVLFFLVREDLLVALKDHIIWLIPVNLELPLHAELLSLLLPLRDLLLELAGQLLEIDPLFWLLFLLLLPLCIYFLLLLFGLLLKTRLDLRFYIFSSLARPFR